MSKSEFVGGWCGVRDTATMSQLFAPRSAAG